MNDSNKPGKISGWLIVASAMLLLGILVAVSERAPAPSSTTQSANSAVAKTADTTEPAASVAEEPAHKHGDAEHKHADAKQTSSAIAIKMLTPADYATELDTADKVLIQVCLPENCASDRAVLERIAVDFDNVKFVQMSTADNKEFALRIEQEQKVLVEKDSSLKPLAYPVYAFKGADLNIAPVSSEEELKALIASFLGGAAEPESDDQVK